MGIKNLSVLTVLVCLIAACAEGHCRKKVDHPMEPKDVTEGAVAAQAGSVNAPTNGEKRVFVYKYDGSLQCGRGKEIALDVMEKQLTGVAVFSREKKPDGMMHIQACGTITGMTNVYEISAKDLKKAEAKGFKLWEF